MAISCVLLEEGLTLKKYLEKRGGALKSENIRTHVIYGWPLKQTFLVAGWFENVIPFITTRQLKD